MHPDQIGPYRIEKKIGAGGMGNVYLGRHETSGQVVAVKALPVSMSREEGFVLRFNREIDALRKVAHPNIVAFYDAGVDGETYYYAMEYVDGETLTQRIRRDKRIPWREAVDIAIQICGALKAAHDTGVIHRDLKPSNLMLDQQGRVKLTDFGVAQVFASAKLTVTGGVIGTAEYMSPEQSQGQRATKRSDLYSLGAVLYVMLTGRPPFTGNTTVEIMHKHRFGRFDRPKLYVTDLPHWLDDLVAQLLEKEPEKRPPDAYVLARLLREVLAKADLKAQDDGKTLVEGPITIHDTVPSEVHVDPALGGTLMRDLVRGEIARQQTPTAVSAAFNNIWVLVTLLVLLVFGVAWWSQRTSLTPEERFQAGVDLMQQPAGEAWQQARARYFAPLIQADANRWQADVQPYLDEIEAFELGTLQAPPRRRGKRKSLRSEPERILDEVRRDWEQGDYDSADARLSALASLLAADPGAKSLLNVVETWQTALAEIQRDLPNRQAYLEAILQRAESLSADQPAETQRLLAAVIELYQDDRTVQEQVDRARRLLEAVKRNSAQPAP